MGIMQLTNSLGSRYADMSLKEILRKQQAEENPLPLAQSAPEPEAVKRQEAQPYSNVMAGNFFNRSYEKSEYTQGRLEGFAIDQSLGNKLGQLVNVLSASYNQALAELRERRQGSALSPSSVDPKYLAAYQENQKAGRGVAVLVTEEITEKASEHLEESRNDIEKKAKEASAPRDAQGNILPGYTGVSAPTLEMTGETATQAPEAATLDSGVTLIGGSPWGASIDIVI